jgi:hypothetical protein
MAGRYTEPIPRLKAEVTRLEALYDEVERQVERHGGVDYTGRLRQVRADLEAKREELGRMEGHFARLRRAAESTGPETAALMVDLLLEEEDAEPIEEIAADFIENEVGHYDWVNNWPVIRNRGEALAKVQTYLDTYGIRADARLVVDEIERMLVENPGHWK